MSKNDKESDHIEAAKNAISVHELTTTQKLNKFNQNIVLIDDYIKKMSDILKENVQLER